MAAILGCGRVTADGITTGIGVVEDVVTHRGVSAITGERAFSGGSSIVWARPLGAITLADLIFAGRLDAVVGLDDHVPLERDIGAPVTVESVGVVFTALSGICDPADVIDSVAADF